MVLRTAGEPAILERENLWNLDDGSCVGLLFFFSFASVPAQKLDQADGV
jgi:hypothetical protein